MNNILAVRERSQTVGEEIANSLSHGIGLVAALIALPLLVLSAVQSGDALSIIGVSVFAGTMVLLYLASTVYHALPNSRAKRVLLVLDHSAIFLFIAGTYTPFTLGVLRGAWGWTLLGLVWALALFGLIVKAVKGANRSRLSIGLYLGMGWLALIAIGPVWLHVPLAGIEWLLAGGIAYTVGLIFFTAERLRYSHFVWHLFVLAGTACHGFAVLWYAV